MKIFNLFIVFALLLVPISVSAQCIHSADDYAVEVVLNKPGIDTSLGKLANANNVIVEQNRYIFQSAYSETLAAILETQSGLTCGVPEGLSVRLQIPVMAEQSSVNYLKFVSTSYLGSLNVSRESDYNGWSVYCLGGSPVPQCEFKKGKTSILASLVSGRYEITVETEEVSSGCGSCDGKCISSSGGMCIDKQLKSSINDMIVHGGLASNFDSLFASYRVIGSGVVSSSDLVPQTSPEINWGLAPQSELERLKLDNSVLMTNEDISEVASLAKVGAAGQNKRIVYGKNGTGEEGWMYYSETVFSSLTGLENCNEFPISSIPPGRLDFSSGLAISPYYLIPTIITVALAILFTFLIVLAKIVDKNNNKTH